MESHFQQQRLLAPSPVESAAEYSSHEDAEVVSADTPDRDRADAVEFREEGEVPFASHFNGKVNNPWRHHSPLGASRCDVCIRGEGGHGEADIVREVA